MVMSELEKLQRNINTLVEATNLDWQALASEPMSPEQQVQVLKSIATRNIELMSLLHQKWALEAKGAQ